MTGNRISIRRNIRYRNSFQTFFVGRLETEIGGTLLQGSFRMHAFVFAFMAVWFGFLALTTGLEFKDDAASIASSGMVMFGVVLVLGGRYAARQEEQQIADFLRRTLEARDS